MSFIGRSRPAFVLYRVSPNPILLDIFLPKASFSARIISTWSLFRVTRSEPAKTQVLLL